MSENLINNAKIVNNEQTKGPKDITESNISPKKISNTVNYIPFTKKWRVKLYILNENGQWDDKGIGNVFLANESEQISNLDGGKQNPGQLIKKLIMLKEKTDEKIFNIDIIKENIDFHNQRGTILTWKKGGSYGQDNNAISFQDKEGVLEILKNIKIINGKKFSEEDLIKEEGPEILSDVSIDNLPNLVREYGPHMEEQKLSEFIEYLKETKFEFIKKLGKILENEEKKNEDVKSCVSYTSLETNVTLNIKRDNSGESSKEITNCSENNKKINNPCFNKNINYIFNIFKNLILIGENELLEILFNDDCYLITFGAFEYDNVQSNKKVPHRKYFKDIVKFKNPLNIQDEELLQKINQNLRLSYFRDTAFSRLIDDNTNRAINTIIQMNQGEIIQYFINNKEYLDILFSQLKTDEDILIQKDAILFLSELITCSKNVVQSRITFNEVLCEKGILPILNNLVENNATKSTKNNSINKEIKEINQKIKINAIEIFISILSAVPNLVKQYLSDNEGDLLQRLADILLYNTNFGIKYEVSQIFKTLIEGEGEPYDKKIIFNSTIERFINYLISPSVENKNEISSTIQIIIEIFIAWFNTMGFDSQYWLDKFEINKVIIKLLKEENKIIILYTIKLLKVILDNSEHYICIKIITNELCTLLTNIFNKNMKKNNIITSCLLNLFDSISLTNTYILNIIMNYTSEFFYKNKEYFKNIILRYEGKSTPKKTLLSYLNINTITETSLKEIEPIFCTSQDISNPINFKDNDYEEDFNYYNNNLLKDVYEEENDLINKGGDLFNIGNNLENKMDYLSKKRHHADSEKNIDDIVDNDDDYYYNYDDNDHYEHLNKRINNYEDSVYKNFNIYCNRKNKNKDYIGLPLKETVVDEDILFNQLEEEDNMY